MLSDELEGGIRRLWNWITSPALDEDKMEEMITEIQDWHRQELSEDE